MKLMTFMDSMVDDSDLLWDKVKAKDASGNDDESTKAGSIVHAQNFNSHISPKACNLPIVGCLSGLESLSETQEQKEKKVISIDLASFMTNKHKLKRRKTRHASLDHNTEGTTSIRLSLSSN